MREFVDERDVDRAEDVLQQLRQLRRLRGREDDDLVADQRVQLAGPLGAGRSQATEQLRRGANRVVAAARVDPLRRVGEVEILAGREAGASLEDRQELLAGRPRVGGRLQHHQLPAAQHRREPLSRRFEVRQVRLARTRERGGNAEHDRVAWPQVGVVDAGAQAIEHRRQRRVGDVLDVAPPRVQRHRLGRGGVDADHLLPRLGEGHGERQADIAEANDPDLHRRAV